MSGTTTEPEPEPEPGPIEAIYRPAGEVVVSPAARQQLAVVRDEWLAPLVAQLIEQAERIGRLEAEREAAQERVARLETELVIARAVQPAPAAPGHAAGPEAPTPVLSRWQRLWLAWYGE